MTLSKSSSNTLNFLKCLLCIGIVFIHVQFRPGQSILLFGAQWSGTADDYYAFNLFKHLFSDIFLNETFVPLFFTISGFLFFLNAPQCFNIEWFKNKWVKRFHSILIPYLIANGIIIALVMAYNIAQNNPIHVKQLIEGFWADDTGLPANPPLWFLRDLILVILLSPFVYLIEKKISWFLPALLGALWLLGIPHTSMAFWKARAYFFFSLGSCFSINKIDFVSFFEKPKYAVLCFLLYVATIICYMKTENLFILNTSILLSFSPLVFVASSLSKRFNSNKYNQYVVVTFFIYLYHYYVAQFMWRPFCAVFGTSEVALFLAYFLGAFATIILLSLVFYLLKRYLPKITAVIVGGRV